MKLTAAGRTDFARAIDRRWDASRSIVLRYAPAVRFHGSPGPDAEVRARLEANSLGEGARVLPLLTHGGVEVSVLDESTLMATGTLKAVDGCLTASLLQTLGVDRIAFESGGNTGTALTTYGQRAGIETFFFCPLPNVDLLESRLFRVAGAHLVAVEEASFVKEAARIFCALSGIRHIPEVELRYSASMFRGLFLLEEIFAGRRVDCLVQAVSAAFGPIGIYRVLRAFGGELPRLPMFVGVQQAENCPMVEEWRPGSESLRTGSEGRSLSRVMYDRAPQTYGTFEELRDLLEATGGDLISVGEAEFDARLGGGLVDLLNGVGIPITVRGGDVVEKTGLMALAGTLGAIDRGIIPPGSHVLCCLTGGVSRADGLAVPEAVLRGGDDVARYVDRVARPRGTR